MKTIFISSTFKDMHFERDIIHEKVMPELNEYASRYGESVSFCDLRWGVNTGDLENEEGSKKVLSVCLDEIDRCRPYMIVILGERYGWIPEKELIADAVQAKRDFALDELEKSVTALEIEYGALSRPEQLARTLFYFRDFTDDEFPGIYLKEDDRHEEKLLQLKRRIRTLTKGRVKHYTVGWDAAAKCVTGLDAFVELVTRDVRGLMEQDWQEYAKLTPFERDQRAQWDLARQKAGQFAARETLVDSYVEKLKAGQPLLALKGAAGSGKSTLMARLAVRLSENGEQVLPVFCGHTAMSNDALDIIKYLVYDLEERLGLPHREKLSAGKESEEGQEEPDGPGNARKAVPVGQREPGKAVEAVPGGPDDPGAETPEQEAADHREAGQENQVQLFTARLAELVAAYGASGGKRLIILLDALDQLMEDETRDRLFFIPPNLSAKVQMVISCLDTFSLPGIGAAETEQVTSLADAGRREVIYGITSFLGRELEDVVVERMAKKSASGSPLYLSLLIQRLLMMNRHDFDEITAGGDGMAAITAHQLGILDGADDTLEGVCVDLLEAASARIGGGFVKAAARYIAASRHGLRESDIEALLAGDGVEYNSLDFSLFIRYMRSFFLLRDDGRYDFAHRSIREGILADCRADVGADVVLAGASGSAVMESGVAETDGSAREAGLTESGADPIRELHRRLLAHLEGLKEDDPVRIREITYHACMAGDRVFLVHYLTRYEKCLNSGTEEAAKVVAEESLKAAAKDVRDFSLADGGALAVSLLNHSGPELPGRELLTFVNFELDDAFGVSQRELETEQRIAEAAIGLARERMEQFGTDQSRRDLTTCYYTMGSICNIFGGNEQRKRIMQMYEEALDIRESLYEKESTMARKKNLAYALGKMSDACVLEGSAGALERVNVLRRRRLALREEIAGEDSSLQNLRYLADACEDLGDACWEQGTKESLQEAYELYRRALKLREERLGKEDTVSARWKLADTCRGFGIVCRRIGTRGMLQRAEELYARAEELYVQTDRIRKSVSSRKDLARIYANRGDLSTLIQNGGSSTGTAYYRKAAAIYEQLMQELCTADSRDDVAQSYLELAGALKLSGDQKSLTEALAWYEKAVRIREELVEELRTSKSRELLADAWHGMAGARQSLGGQRDYEEALGLYRKAQDIRETLVAEQDTAVSRMDLAGSMKAIGFLLIGMGRGFEEFFPYIRREQELLTEVDRERGTDDSRQRLADVCFQMAQAYSRAGGEERLRRAEEMCREGIRIQREVAENRNTRGAFEILAMLYMQAGEISTVSGSRVSLERALSFFGQAWQVKEEQGWENGFEEERLRGRLLADMGSVYYLLGGSDLAMARERLERACAVFERLEQEAGMAEDREWLARCCNYLALVCQATLEADQRKRAEELLIKAASLREKAERQQGTAAVRDNLAEAWFRLGEFYAEDSDGASIRQAKEMYQRARNLWQGLKEEGYAGVEKNGLPACDMALGALWAKLGGDENNRKALSCIQSARERYEQSLAEHRSAKNLRVVADTWIRTGDVLLAGRGAEDIKQAEQAFGEALALSADAEAEPETTEGRNLMARCEARLAGLYETYGDSAHMRMALEGYRKAYELRKESLREEDSVQNVINAAMTCRSLGVLHYKLEREEDLKRSLALHEEELGLLLPLEERIGAARLRTYLSGTYECLGNVLRRMGGSGNLVRAREEYGRFLQTVREIAEESALTEDARSVAIAYEKCGDICMEAGAQEDKKEAVRLFGLEKGVWEQLKERLERLDYLRGIAIAWQKQGTAYKELDEEDAAEQAEACIRQSLLFWQQLWEESGLIQNERDIAVCYERLGDLAHRKGGAAEDEALAYYGKEEEIWRRQIDALGTADAKRGLSFTLGKQAAVYQKRSGEESRGSEIKLRAEKLSLDRDLAEELGTPKALKEYATDCRRLGRLFADGDSLEEKRQALALYETYLAQAEAMRQEGMLTDEDDALCVAWQMKASLRRALGGEDAGRQAAEAYEKALTYFAHEEGDEEESAADRKDRMKICMNIASAYLTEGSREALELAFPYSEKACRMAGDFVGETSTIENRDHHALCLMNHGRLCCALGDEEHKKEGIARLKEALALAEELTGESGAQYRDQILTSCCALLGDLFKGCDADSEEALDYYRKGLAYGSQFAAQHPAVANLDNYVVALHRVIIHSGTPVGEKRELTEQMLAVSEQMYERTKNPRHRNFMEFASGLLEILNGEKADEAGAGEDEDAEDVNEKDADAGNDADEAGAGED